MSKDNSNTLKEIVHAFSILEEDIAEAKQPFTDFINTVDRLRNILAKASCNENTYSLIFTHMSQCMLCLIQSVREPNDDEISKIIQLKSFFDTAWVLGGYTSGQSGLRKLLSQKGSHSELQKSFVQKMFLFLPLQDIPESWVPLIETLPKPTIGHLVSSYLCQIDLFLPQFRRNFDWICKNIDRISPPITQAALPMSIISWMHASYLSSDERITFKKYLNNEYRKVLPAPEKNRKSLKDNKKSGRPTLVVCIEVMSKHHAMARCYRHRIEQLAENFNIVLLHSAGTVDPDFTKKYQSIEIDFQKDTIDRIVKRIIMLNAVAIYHPSIGMNPLSIFISNIKFSIPQIMSMGHPDSTYSEYVSAAIFNGGAAKEIEAAIQNYCSEKTYFAEKFAASYTLPVPAPRFKKIKNQWSGTVNIAVNCKYLKLSDEFLRVLAASSVEFSPHVVFKFFPGVGEEYKCVTLKKILKNTYRLNCDVYTQRGYEDYLELLNLCSFAVSPFPFGNTNSIIDASALGIPTLVRLGKEPRSHVDQIIIKEFGLSNLIAQDREQYGEMLNNKIRELLLLIQKGKYSKDYNLQENTFAMLNKGFEDRNHTDAIKQAIEDAIAEPI